MNKLVIILVLLFGCNIAWGKESREYSDAQYATGLKIDKLIASAVGELKKEIDQLSARIAELENQALVILGEGWRPSEFAALNWRDGKYPQDFVWIIGTKNGRAMSTVIQPEIETEWRKPPEDEGRY